MGRKNLKPKSKQPSKVQKDDSLRYPGADGHKIAMGASIAGIVASLICVTVFFQSDIRTKIVAAQTSEAVQEQAAPGGADRLVIAPQDGTPSAEPDAEAVPANGTLPNDEKSSGGGEVPAEDRSGIEVAPGAVIPHDVLEQHLMDMETGDFTALAESVDQLIAAHPELVNLPERKSLAEAYAEAEAKYPGQIDGSQRLKLVDELNAIDYKYYVAEDGDTLLELSKVFSIPLGQLVETNGIHEADKIKAGAILLLPSETVQPE